MYALISAMCMSLVLYCVAVQAASADILAESLTPLPEAKYLKLIAESHLELAKSRSAESVNTKEKLSRLYCDLGELYEKKKQFTLAEKQYAQLFALWAADTTINAPYEIEFFSNLIGRRYSERCEYAKAKPLIDTAVKLSKMLPPGLDDYSRGEIAATQAEFHQRQHHWKEAETAWLDAIKFSNPNYQTCRLELFELYFATGQLSKAEEALNESDRAMYNHRHELRKAQIKLLQRQNKFVEAIVPVSQVEIVNFLDRVQKVSDCWGASIIFSVSNAAAFVQ